MRPDPKITIELDEDVYAPSDDTFLLLHSIEVSEGERVLEVGTGCGIIALHCARAGAVVTAVDVSEMAVENAKRNAENNHIGLDVRRNDLVKGIDETFDVVIFNPPYLSCEGAEKLVAEDAGQLIGGKRGAELSVRFLDEVASVLNDGARIYILTSSEGGEEVLAHAKKSYRISLVAGKNLFFEKLAVYELNKIR